MTNGFVVRALRISGPLSLCIPRDDEHNDTYSQASIAGRSHRTVSSHRSIYEYEVDRMSAIMQAS